MRSLLILGFASPPPGLEPFDFAFDRGCYHHVRRDDAIGYVEMAKQLSRAGTQILIIAANADATRYRTRSGVKQEELRGDFSKDFEIVRLDSVFLTPAAHKIRVNPLGWH